MTSRKTRWKPIVTPPGQTSACHRSQWSRPKPEGAERATIKRFARSKASPITTGCLDGRSTVPEASRVPSRGFSKSAETPTQAELSSRSPQARRQNRPFE